MTKPMKFVNDRLFLKAPCETCVLHRRCLAWLWDFSQTLRKTRKASRELSPPSAGKAWAKKIGKTWLLSPESIVDPSDVKAVTLCRLPSIDRFFMKAWGGRSRLV